MGPLLQFVFSTPFKFFHFSQKNLLTNHHLSVNIIFAVDEMSLRAGVAQLVEQLICNQQVGGSNPSTSSISYKFIRRSTQVAKGDRL